MAKKGARPTGWMPRSWLVLPESRAQGALWPLEHRGEASQAHLLALISALALNSSITSEERSQVVWSSPTHKCSTACFPYKKVERRTHTARTTAGLRAPARDHRVINCAHIHHYDRELEELAQEHYPQTKLFVGASARSRDAVRALTFFVLTLEEPGRFEERRQVGAYLGLVPGKEHSGERDPQERISRLERVRRC